MMESVDINFYLDVFLLFWLVVTAVAVVFAKNLMASTILMGIFSLLMAAEYLVMGAADVAITEAAVGAGISSILILMALFLVGDREAKQKGNMVVPLVVTVIVTAGLLFATYDMPSFGNQFAPAQIYVSPYYLENGPIETGVPNVVTSILASYRAFDTLGEVVVVLTASISVIMLLGRLRKKEEGDK